MTTSGTINSQITAGTIVAQAMRLIGALPSGQSASNDEISDGVLQLNWMLKSMQADGMNLFRRTQETANVSANTQTLTLSPTVQDVPEARWVQSINPTYERQMGCFQYQQYMELPTKSAASSSGPTIFMFDKQVDATYLWLWPLPSAGGTINYTASRIIDDVTNQAQTLDLPQEWMETAIYSLADRLIDTYGISLSDPRTADRISARAASLYQKMLNYDRPNSVFLKPWGSKGRGPIWRG